MLKALYKLTGIISICTLMTACSGLFDTDNTPKPTPLKSIQPVFTPKQLWVTSVGQNGYQWLRQSPALSNNVLYTTSESGDVYAIDATTGRHLWHVRLKGQFAAGPAVFNDTVIVVNRTGHVYALDTANAKIKWEQHINSEVLANPAINEQVVVIKTSDGELHGLRKDTGALSWAFKQNEPNLILHSASTPRFEHNQLYAGFANGNLVKLNASTGKTLWVKPVAIPEGAFAIERMIDIDADPAPFGNRVFAASFQGKIVAFDAQTGHSLWSQTISSYTGMAMDNDGLFITDASGALWAFDTYSGKERFHQTDLLARGLSAPAMFGNYVIVGDRQGFVHWFNKQNGHIAARIGLGSAILATPLVDNGRLFLLTQQGNLSAYQL